MVHPADDLRRHIAWSTACIAGIVGLIDASNPQICDADVASGIKHEILGLDVSMDDTVILKIL